MQIPLTLRLHLISKLRSCSHILCCVCPIFALLLLAACSTSSDPSNIAAPASASNGGASGGLGAGAGGAGGGSGDIASGGFGDIYVASDGVTQRGLVARLVSVIDGDTIHVEVDGEVISVRLLGIDTPEKVGGPRPGECYGQQATELAEALLPHGSEVLLTRDHESRDAYGRLLAYVHRRDGVFINYEMLKAGAATPLFFEPNTTMKPLFQAAGDKARKDWIGLWEKCGQPDLVISD